MSWEGFGPLSMFSRRRQQMENSGGLMISRQGSIVMKPFGEALAPLMEGPTPEDFENGNGRKEGSWSQWILSRTSSMSRTPSMPHNPACSSTSARKRSDLRLLLGVLGAPLAPVPVSADAFPHLSIKNTPIESSSAQYIVQQYIATTGCSKQLQGGVRNSYAMGRVKMFASEFETASKAVKARNPAKAAEMGCFVLWQMMPDMWYVEIAVGAGEVHAGCNGNLVWRHTPWLGSHAAKGPVRPLRRTLQGLDPRTIASLFVNSRCIGEKKVRGEDCFILKLSADRQTLGARSDGPAEIIRHILFGYFSQKTGLLVQMEDSHLTRIQASGGGDAVYWETTIDSSMEDYRAVDGIMIAHSGRSVVTLFRFGESALSHTKTRMEEVWSIEEVAFDVPGLSPDCFIPPADIRVGSAVSEASELPPMSEEDRKKGKFPVVRPGSNNSNKVAANNDDHNHSSSNDNSSNTNTNSVAWTVQV